MAVREEQRTAAEQSLAVCRARTYMQTVRPMALELVQMYY